MQKYHSDSFILHKNKKIERFLLMEKKYRLITRNDFDGFVCALLLKKLDLIDDILFVHPRDMQHGRVEIKEGDISANLPYAPGIYMAFDHHVSENKRIGSNRKNFICKPKEPLLNTK